MKCIKNPKNSCLFLAFSIVLFLSSCLKFQGVQQKIDKVFLLLKNNPDSALLLIEELDQLNNKSEYIKANVNLLKFYAKYKTSDNSLPDSLIDQSRNYLIRTKNNYLKGYAFFLTGCSREINNQSDSAVYWYKMADIAFSEIDGMNDIKGLVKYNLGYTYLQHNHVNYALRYFKDAYILLKQSGNVSYMAYILKDISYCCYLADYNRDIYMNILNNAYLLAKSCGDELNCDYILAQKGEFLYETDKIRSKQLIKNHLDKYPFSSEKLTTYLADLYLDEQKFDSAMLYINKINYDNNRNKVLFNLVNFRLHHNKNQLDKSIQYLLLANNLKDSLSFNLQNSGISEIDKRIEFSNHLTEIQNLRFTNKSGLGILLLLTILLMYILFELNRNKTYYSKLTKFLHAKANSFENEMLLVMKSNYEKNVLLHKKVITKTMNTLAFRNLELKTKDQNKIFEFVKESFINDLNNEKEWEVFFEEIDQIFDKKISKLIDEYQITLNDQKVISLISLKYDITDCCLLLNLSKNTLYHRRQLIKERLSLSKDTDLDVWISKYLTADPVPAAMLPSPPAP
jgi:hypothetical protein